MTNLEKGEAVVELRGQNYRLKLGTNALIVLQEALSTPERTPKIEDIFAGVAAGRILYLRAFLWAAMQKHYPTTTLDTVAELLDDAEPHEVAAILIGLGISTVPNPADLKELGVDTENPQKARATARAGKRTRGTGGRSSSRRGASA